MSIKKGKNFYTTHGAWYKNDGSLTFYGKKMTELARYLVTYGGNLNLAWMALTNNRISVAYRYKLQRSRELWKTALFIVRGYMMDKEKEGAFYTQAIKDQVEALQRKMEEANFPDIPAIAKEIRELLKMGGGNWCGLDPASASGDASGYFRGEYELIAAKAVKHLPKLEVVDAEVEDD